MFGANKLNKESHIYGFLSNIVIQNIKYAHLISFSKDKSREWWYIVREETN